MNKRLVYGLIDPVTSEMRYVGATTVGLKRPKSHLRKSAYDGKYRDSHFYRWIRCVINSGYLPEIVVIEYADENQDPFQLEKEWVAYFREIGCSLTNTTDGGEGRLGYTASVETKAKLSARIVTPEWRANQSAAQRKRFAENPVTEETRRKLSVAGLNTSPDKAANLSTAQKKRRQKERDSS